MVLRTAASLLRLDLAYVPQVALTQLRLPLRMGGFGLRSMTHVAPCAFLASIAAAAPSLCVPPSDTLCLDIKLAQDFIGPGPALPSPQDFLPFFSEPSSSRGLQRTLTSRADRSCLSTLYSDKSASVDAHLLSLKQSGASMWLSDVPTRPEFCFSDEEFRFCPFTFLSFP